MKNRTIGILLMAAGVVCAGAGVYVMSTAANKENRVSTQAKKDQSIQKGRDFEEYVIDKFNFSRKSLTLLERNSGTSKKKVDLLISLTTKKANHKIAVECMWRQKLPAESFEWTTEKKLQDWLTSAQKDNAKMFLILGVGGNPKSPEGMYVIPIMEASQNVLSQKMLDDAKCYGLQGYFFYSAESNKLELR